MAQKRTMYFVRRNFNKTLAKNQLW